MNPALFADLLVAGLVTGGIYAVVALGLNLQYGMMRIMNIAHGEFLMLGAYLTYTLVRATGASPLWFLPVVMAALFLLGLALHATVFRRLTATSPTVEVIEARSLIVSFGFMFILQNIAVLVWGANLQGQPYLDTAVQMGTLSVNLNRLLALGLVIAVSGALIFLLQRTLLGKSVRGMLQSPLGALLVGINTGKLHPICFGIGLALAGFAGALLSMIFELSPAMGAPYTISALIIIIIGGLGNITGCLVGAILLGLLDTFGMYFTSPSLQSLISYAVFVLVILFFPRGIFSK
ncbi:MAG: branched-chain amino acid ABC transporter permease [Noviherbaspirillum sp.]